MTPLRALRAYAAHPDPATAAANQIALMLGSNGPIYPIYLFLIVGHRILLPSLFTSFAMPFFLAVPAVSRRHALAGRVMLVGVGTLNTLWCIKLLGPATGLNLILLPCILVALLLYRARERVVFLLCAGVPTLCMAMPPAYFGAPLVTLSPAETAGLASFHRYTAAVLTLFLVWQFAALMRAVAAPSLSLWEKDAMRPHRVRPGQT